MRNVEILPGVGVESAKIGDTRDEVEARIGRPAQPDPQRNELYTSVEPWLKISYDSNDVVEFVEAHSVVGHTELVTFEGVQLTLRLMEGVKAELEAQGYEATEDQIGYVFAPGFCIWSMGSIHPDDLFPKANEADVGIAPYAYLTQPIPEEA